MQTRSIEINFKYCPTDLIFSQMFLLYYLMCYLPSRSTRNYILFRFRFRFRFRNIHHHYITLETEYYSQSVLLCYFYWIYTLRAIQSSLYIQCFLCLLLCSKSHTVLLPSFIDLGTNL